MAKTIKKISKKERVEKSLAAAAKVLNKAMHVPEHFKVSAFRENGGGGVSNAVKELVKVHQVWCEDDEEVIGLPTTDYNEAKNIRDDHNNTTGHLSRILTSN